jgi:hypothetical protein
MQQQGAHPNSSKDLTVMFVAFCMFCSRGLTSDRGCRGITLEIRTREFHVPPCLGIPVAFESQATSIRKFAGRRGLFSRNVTSPSLALESHAITDFARYYAWASRGHMLTLLRTNHALHPDFDITHQVLSKKTPVFAPTLAWRSALSNLGRHG